MKHYWLLMLIKKNSFILAISDLSNLLLQYIDDFERYHTLIAMEKI